MFRKLLVVLIVAFTATTHAQTIDRTINRNDFLRVDAQVARVGAMEGYTVKMILDKLIDTSWSEIEKLRAIYMWEVKYIAFDCKAYHHPRNYASNANVALNERKTTSKGYAEFFKALCNVSGIKCDVVEGLLRKNPDKIGDIKSAKTHFWNIATTKDGTKYLVDATLGAGYTDEKHKIFTPEVTDAWWLSYRELFAFSHLPNDKRNQLLTTPITKSQYYSAPIIHLGALILGVFPPETEKGIIRSRQDTTLFFSYRLTRPENIVKVALSIDDGTSVPVDFSLSGSGITVAVPFKKAGEQLLSLYFNDKQCVSYKAKIREYKRIKPRQIPVKK